MSNLQLKKNLIDLDNGYFISRNDPLLWKKLLERRPDNEEAMYYFGLEVEKNAKKCLNQYHSTKLEKYLTLYNKLIKQSFHLVKQSFNKGFIPAQNDIFRMEKEMSSIEATLDVAEQASNLRNTHYILFALAVLIGIIAAAFFSIN